MGDATGVLLAEAFRDVPPSPAGVAVRLGGGVIPFGCSLTFSAASRLVSGHGVGRLVSGTLPDGTAMSREEGMAWFLDSSGDAAAILAGDVVLEGGVRRFTMAIGAILAESTLPPRQAGPFLTAVLVADGGMEGPCRVTVDAPSVEAASLIAGLIDCLGYLGHDGFPRLLGEVGLMPSRTAAEAIIARAAPVGVLDWLGTA